MQSSITLVIIDTENYELASKAIQNSIKQFNFKEVLIFSDKNDGWDGYPVVIIEKIKSITDYNRIVIKQLPNFVATQMVMIIQYDGFVLDGNRWLDYFQNFDYIGAPWHDEDGWVVGNGGFSLRSRNLIEKIANARDFDSSVAEDVFICKRSRRDLQQTGLRFAPIEVARRFSFEWPNVKWNTFGFHGIFNLPLVYRNEIEFLVHSISPNTLARRWKYLASGIIRHTPSYLPVFLKLLEKYQIPLE